MGKRITDNDAFAGGIAAYAMMQSLLKHLEEAGAPRKVIREIIEDAALALELVSRQMRPKHPAVNAAIMLLRGSAAKWQRPGEVTQTSDGEALGLLQAISTVLTRNRDSTQ